MTTPNQPDRITPDELRAEFAAVHAEIADLHAALTTLRDGLRSAGSQTPAAPGGDFAIIQATEIVMGYDDKGAPSYKAKGGSYQKFGVRIWPEILPALGIDPATLKPGPNPVDLALRVALVTHLGDDGQPRQTPQKVIGLA